MTISSPVNSQAVLLANVAMPLVETIQVDAPKELTNEELIIAAAKEAKVDGNIAIKVASCESGLRQFNAETGEPLRGVHNPADVGIFQINEAYHLKESQQKGYDIYTKDGNIGYAMYLMKKDGLRHWNSSKPCWNKDTA